MKKKLFILFIVSMLTATLVLFTGCSVRFAKNDEEVVDIAVNEWYSATNKTQKDVYKIKDLLVKFNTNLGEKVVTVNATSTITRTFADGNVNISIKIDGISIAMDKILAEILKINVEGFARVEYIAEIDLKSVNLTFKQIVRGWNSVVEGGLQEDELTTTLNLGEYADILNYVRKYSDIILIGSIPKNGELDRSKLSYKYTLENKKVNNELLKVFNTLLEANQNTEIGDNGLTIKKFMENVFGSFDLSIIAGRYFNNSQMPVKCSLAPSKKNYYFSLISGDFSTQGEVPKEVIQKLFNEIENINKNGNNFGNLITGKAEIKGEIKLTSSFVIA